MAMYFYEYRGFIIYPTPKRSLDATAWTIELSIRLAGNIKVFKSGHTFSTEGEAVFHCIDFGKRIIDGEVEDLTVYDLL
ncbi:MAG: hypothetical protein EHM36_16320 [Deltaproteobacteria bacterium]|nr:MAG: hypothetical protein EHM36_16320 [Deltaproteobacteria bacterium]